MIRKATAADTTALCPRTTAGHKIHGLFLAYGADYDFLPFWTDDNGGFAACLSGCVMADVSATAADAITHIFCNLISRILIIARTKRNLITCTNICIGEG